MKIAIIGMGASGASLASFLSSKEELEISIFEPALSRKNHLWGFWDDGSPTFEAARNCRQHSWDSLAFVHGEQRRQVDVPQSPYSVVNSRDFIQSCEKNLRDSARINRESVISLSENPREAISKPVSEKKVLIWYSTADHPSFRRILCSSIFWGVGLKCSLLSSIRKLPP